MPQEFALSQVLLEQLSRTAEAVGISVDRLVALAIAEKVVRIEHGLWMVDQGRACALPDAHFLMEPKAPAVE